MTDKKITLSTLTYYDGRLKDWVSAQIENAEISSTQNTWLIKDELVSYFNDLGATPTKFNNEEWTEEKYPISEMTVENGPYLVIVVKDENTDVVKYYVQTMEEAFSKYATTSDLAEVAAKVESFDELEII